MVEFAITAPLLFFTVLVGIQLALFVGQQFNVMQVTRETVRWVAIHPHTTDAATLTYARSIGRPGMVASQLTSVSVSPACPMLNADGRCTSREGVDEISVQIDYNVRHVFFMPTTVSIGGLTASIPSTLPPFKVWAPIE